MSTVAEVRIVDGRPQHRLAGAPHGAWTEYESAVDALVGHVVREMRMPTYGAKGAVLGAVGIPASNASRARAGLIDIPIDWVFRLHDYTGIPVEELRWIAGLPQERNRHKNARVAWKAPIARSA